MFLQASLPVRASVRSLAGGIHVVPCLFVCFLSVVPCRATLSIGIVWCCSCLCHCCSWIYLSKVFGVRLPPVRCMHPVEPTSCTQGHTVFFYGGLFFCCTPHRFGVGRCCRHLNIVVIIYCCCCGRHVKNHSDLSLPSRNKNGKVKELFW